MPPSMMFPGMMPSGMMPPGMRPPFGPPKETQADPRMRLGSRSKSRDSDAPPRSPRAGAESVKAESTTAPTAAGVDSGTAEGHASVDEGSRDQQPEKIDWVHLPRALIGQIIGKAGATIKDIREQSGARIDARDVAEDPVQVLISGTNKAVVRAKFMLLDVAEGAALTLGRDSGDVNSDAGAAAVATTAIVAVTDAKVAAAPVVAVTDAKVAAALDAFEAMERAVSSEQRPPEKRKRKAFSDGPPAIDTLALAIPAPLAEASSSSATPSVEEVLELPQHSTGKVIGTKGVHIAEVRDKSGAQIDIDQVGVGCRVRLHGTPEQVALARTLITHILAPPLAGDFLEIPRNAVGRIIGAGGSRIQELQERSSAKIDIDRTNPERCLVRFAGTEEAVADAKALVLEVLEGRTTAGAGDTVHTMVVASTLTGRLIGPGGKNINEIQERSGAKLDIDKGTDPVTVRMTGTAEAVAKAQTMVQEVINGTGSAPSLGGPPQLGAPFGGGDVRASVARAAAAAAQFSSRPLLGRADEEETITFDIPLHVADRVLGNGSWMQLVEQKTGARIATRTDGSSCCLVLSGQPEQVVEAEQMAEDAVRYAACTSAGGTAPLPPPPGVPGLSTMSRPPSSVGQLLDACRAPVQQPPPVLTAHARPSMAAAAAAAGPPQPRPAPPGAIMTPLRPSMHQLHFSPPGRPPLAGQGSQPPPVLTASLRPSMAAAAAPQQLLQPATTWY